MLHVAFLRGIGPARKASGAELRACLGRAGFDPVVPILATGNVILGRGDGMEPEAAEIEAVLKSHFGYAIPVILRSQSEIRSMFAKNPFANVDPQAYTRFVTLLGGTKPETLPEPPADANYRIVGATGADLFVVRENNGAGTPEMMAYLQKALGKTITTRNWNTMEKIAARLESA